MKTVAGNGEIKASHTQYFNELNAWIKQTSSGFEVGQLVGLFSKFPDGFQWDLVGACSRKRLLLYFATLVDFRLKYDCTIFILHHQFKYIILERWPWRRIKWSWPGTFTFFNILFVWGDKQFSNIYMLLSPPCSNESDIQIYSIWKSLVELLIAFLHSKRITRGWAQMCFNPLLKTAPWPMSNLIQSKKQLQKPPQYSVYCDPFPNFNLFVREKNSTKSAHRGSSVPDAGTQILMDFSTCYQLGSIKWYFCLSTVVANKHVPSFHGWLLVYKNRCSCILIVFLPG